MLRNRTMNEGDERTSQDQTKTQMEEIEIKEDEGGNSSGENNKEEKRTKEEGNDHEKPQTPEKAEEITILMTEKEYIFEKLFTRKPPRKRTRMGSSSEEELTSQN